MLQFPGAAAWLALFCSCCAAENRRHSPSSRRHSPSPRRHLSPLPAPTLHPMPPWEPPTKGAAAERHRISLQYLSLWVLQSMCTDKHISSVGHRAQLVERLVRAECSSIAAFIGCQPPTISFVPSILIQFIGSRSPSIVAALGLPPNSPMLPMLPINRISERYPPAQQDGGMHQGGSAAAGQSPTSEGRAYKGECLSISRVADIANAVPVTRSFKVRRTDPSVAHGSKATPVVSLQSASPGAIDKAGQMWYVSRCIGLLTLLLQHPKLTRKDLKKQVECGMSLDGA